MPPRDTSSQGETNHRNDSDSIDAKQQTQAAKINKAGLAMEVIYFARKHKYIDNAFLEGELGTDFIKQRTFNVFRGELKELYDNNFKGDLEKFPEDALERIIKAGAKCLDIADQVLQKAVALGIYKKKPECKINKFEEVQDCVAEVKRYLAQAKVDLGEDYPKQELRDLPIHIAAKCKVVYEERIAKRKKADPVKSAAVLNEAGEEHQPLLKHKEVKRGRESVIVKKHKKQDRGRSPSPEYLGSVTIRQYSQLGLDVLASGESDLVKLAGLYDDKAADLIRFAEENGFSVPGLAKDEGYYKKLAAYCEQAREIAFKLGLAVDGKNRIELLRSVVSAADKVIAQAEQFFNRTPAKGESKIVSIQKSLEIAEHIVARAKNEGHYPQSLEKSVIESGRSLSLIDVAIKWLPEKLKQEVAPVSQSSTGIAMEVVASPSDGRLCSPSLSSAVLPSVPVPARSSSPALALQLSASSPALVPSLQQARSPSPSPAPALQQSASYSVLDGRPHSPSPVRRSRCISRYADKAPQLDKQTEPAYISGWVPVVKAIIDKAHRPEWGNGYTYKSTFFKGDKPTGISEIIRRCPEVEKINEMNVAEVRATLKEIFSNASARRRERTQSCFAFGKNDDRTHTFYRQSGLALNAENPLTVAEYDVNISNVF